MSCNEKGCDNKALYGFKTKNACHCKQHKVEGMVYQPLNYCKHEKRKAHCKDCDGSQICKHGRQRNRCKEPGCGGASICEHGRVRNQCKECGGSQICNHGRQRSTCKDCRGASICEHGRVKNQCKDCGGSSICDHGRQRSQCKECRGASICEHGRRRNQCRECGGASYCEHSRVRSLCKECGGSSICEHGRRRNRCKECGGSQLCKTVYCNTIASNKAYKGYCLFCFVNTFPDETILRNYKTKEKNVVDSIKEKYPEFDWKHDRTVENGFSKRRPDLLLDLGTHVIIVEIDENKHNKYECICENKRLMEISKDLNHRPIIMLRFNPDAYTNDKGVKIPSPWTTNKRGILKINKKREKEWNDRIAILQETIKYWIENSTDKTVEIIQLFYDMDLDDILSKEFGNMSLS